MIAHMVETVGLDGLLADYWATETSGGRQFNSLTRVSGDGRITVQDWNNNIATRTIFNGYDRTRSQLEALTNVEGLCDRFRARGNIEVHTIGFDINNVTDDFTFAATPQQALDDGDREEFVLGQCAINTNGLDVENRHIGSADELDSIFTDISNDIHGLRLTN